VIQVKCPKCREVVRLDDDLAGGVGTCTECGQKFRVPTPKATSQISARPPAAGPRPKAEEPEEDEDVLAEVDEEEDEADTKPKKRKARRADEDDDEDDEDRPRRRRRRRRPKKWSGELIPGVSMTVTAFLAVLLVWLVLAGVAILPVPVVSGAALSGLVLLGLALIVGGRIWLVVLAFHCDQYTGCMVLFFPFYSLRFVAENQDDAGKPFLLFLIGILMVISAGVVAAVHG
jgi:hypothetical protein